MTDILEGKRCLVTGASGGLGAALAREFRRAGCRMILTGRHEAKLEILMRQLTGDADVADYLVADLATDEGLDRLIEHIMREHDGLDILVNNAGVFPVGEIGSISMSDLDECLALNLRVPAVLCRAFAPAMIERGWGRIVNIASSSAYAGFAGTAAYCASKHGLLGLSRALDDEMRTHGVRVISVSPGSIKTPMGRNVPGQTYDNFMEPREVAEIVCRVTALDGSVLINEIRLGRMAMG